jgi:hypothetical protein
VLFDKLEIAFFPQLLGIRGFAADEAKTRDPSAFLVNRNKGLNLTEVTEIVDELA